MNDSSSKQKILIVDDEPLNIKVLTEILKSEYEIHFATNGPDALETAFSDTPDLVLLDIMMPGMDGYEVCNKLTESQNTNKIPIIFITAKSEDSDETKGLELGAVDYIKKPFNRAIVKARVKTHLLLKKAHETLENQNEILKQKVKKRTWELERTQIEIAERLGLAAEYRDEETGNHIRRMSEYCRILGQLSGFSPEDCDILALSSTLHDIGKISIPDGVLLKPGGLTEDERKIMMTHTKIGAKLLSGSRSRLLQMAEAIAHTHHERWDGTGYPKGLKGEEIPLEGRITAVADTFDAYISKRPYKDAWPMEKAMDEIRKRAGSHFDPKLVSLFLELVPKLKEIKAKFE